MHATAAACSIALALHLHPGAHLVENDALDDRIAWVLPPDRLAAMSKGGFVIDEDMRTTVVTHATVDPADHRLYHLQGETSKTVTDVPRHRVNRSTADIDTRLTPLNEAVPAQRIDIESSPMAGLPRANVCIGARWRTRLPVMTTLGSGIITIDHTVLHADARSIVVSVKGLGTITGVEYNLPRLLPGAMSIEGTARFDPASGDVTAENYVVRNRLIRTVKSKTIGFLETETVRAVTTVSAPAPDPRTHR